MATMATMAATAAVTVQVTAQGAADRTQLLSELFEAPTPGNENVFPNPFTAYRPKVKNDGFAKRRYEGWR